MMKIKIKCFSQVKYALETDELILELESGITTDALQNVIRCSNMAIEHKFCSILCFKINRWKWCDKLSYYLNFYHLSTLHRGDKHYFITIF